MTQYQVAAAMMKPAKSKNPRTLKTDHQKALENLSLKLILNRSIRMMSLHYEKL